MTIPMWMLLGFATWTLLLLMATVGVYRWVRILFSNVPIASFRSDQLEGEDWYRRGTKSTRELRGKSACLWRHRVGDFSPWGRRSCSELPVHNRPDRSRVPVSGSHIPCANRYARGGSVYLLFRSVGLFSRAHCYSRLLRRMNIRITVHELDEPFRNGRMPIVLDVRPAPDQQRERIPGAMPSRRRLRSRAFSPGRSCR